MCNLKEARQTNVSGVLRSLQSSKLSFNHSIGRTRPRTQVTFINFYKNRNNIAAAGIHSLQHIEVPAVPTTIQLVASDYTD